MKKTLLITAMIALGATSCKKEGCMDQNASNYNHDAEKDNGTCEFNAPTTYNFTDDSGNSTVSYSGQTDRLNQLEELTTYAKSGTSQMIDAQVMKDMFANVGGNGNGNFSFTSSKDLQSKCFALDTANFLNYFDLQAAASADYAMTASDGQAGTLTSGTSTYLFDANGIEYAQMIDKGIMGAVFYYQLNSVYLGDDKMNVDNTNPVDPSAGKYYTAMEHHFDEAFGYFGVPTDFPTNITGIRFWGKYCNARDADYGFNSIIMDAFLNGRHAIAQNDLTSRDAAITTLRMYFEKLTAAQAVAYIDSGLGYFGNDNAKFLHAINEAYAFINAIRYSPVETRMMTPTEVDALLANFGTNLWNLTTTDLNTIKSSLVSTYGL